MPNYSLTPQLESFVAERVAAGGYNNASEVVRDALRILQQREQRLATLDASIRRGLDEAARGEGRSADDIIAKLEHKFSTATETAKR